MCIRLGRGDWTVWRRTGHWLLLHCLHSHCSSAVAIKIQKAVTLITDDSCFDESACTQYITALKIRLSDTDKRHDRTTPFVLLTKTAENAREERLIPLWLNTYPQRLCLVIHFTLSRHDVFY